MKDLEEITDAETEMLSPGEYLVWSPYDSYEAAAALMRALAEDEEAQKLGNKLPVSEAQRPTVLRMEEQYD